MVGFTVTIRCGRSDRHRPDGSIETLTPQIREYQEQRIDGLPKKMVTPPEDVLARII